MILLCIPAHIGLRAKDLEIIEELKHFGKGVHIVLTKIDKVDNNEQLVKTMSSISAQLLKYNYFIKPEIHLISARHSFGIKDLRSRIAVAFELNNYI